MQYVDAIKRVFYHLRGALDEPNFMTEQITQRMMLVRGITDGSQIIGEGPGETDLPLNLEELFKNVLEEDRHQPDQSMRL